jgi:Transposase IS66 family
VDRDHPCGDVLADRRALQPRAVRRADRHELPGIVVSDRWNGFEHRDPHQRQVCWSHIQRDFRRHSEGLGEQKTFGEQGLELTRRVFSAWRAYQHEHHDRDRLKTEIAPIQTNYGRSSKQPARRAGAPARLAICETRAVSHG